MSQAEKEIKARRKEIVTESKTGNGARTYAFFRDHGIETSDYEGSFVAVLGYVSGKIDNQEVTKMIRAIVHDSIYHFLHLEVNIDLARSLMLDDGTEIIFRSGGRGNGDRILIEVKKYNSVLEGKVEFHKLFCIRPEEDGTASIEEVAQCIFANQSGRAKRVFGSEGYHSYLNDPAATAGLENPELIERNSVRVGSVGFDNYSGADLAKQIEDLYEIYRVDAL